MTPGILGDTTDREYTGRLQRFIRFAEREIKQVLDSLAIRPGDRVLDVGCGAGMTTTWLAERAGPAGLAAGFDLSGPHCKIAHDVAPHAKIVQADLQRAPFRSAAFDLVWTLNTVNHLVPVEDGLAALSVLLRPGGLLVAVQSHFLPEMLFAWDASLERAVTDACHQYYRDKYHLQVQCRDRRHWTGDVCIPGVGDGNRPSDWPAAAGDIGAAIVGILRCGRGGEGDR